MATQLDRSTVKGATHFHRPSYEAIAGVCWVVGGLSYLVIGRSYDGDLASVSYLSLPMLAMGIYRFRQVFINLAFKVKMTSPLHPWLTVERLLKKQSDASMTFVGRGFVWEPVHARIMREIGNLATVETIAPPAFLKKLLVLFRFVDDEDAKASVTARNAAKDSSHHYIHGCGEKETDIFVSYRARRSHTLVLGTNGAGKTRLLETLVAQDVARGCLSKKELKVSQSRLQSWAEHRTLSDTTPTPILSAGAADEQTIQPSDLPRWRRPVKAASKSSKPKIPTATCGPVFILDPKGDRDLRDRAYATACKYGRGNDFYFFSPTESDVSFRVNPLANYNRQTELANRVTSLLPTGGDSDAFRQFAWRAVNVVINGMSMAGVKINLLNLRANIEGGIETLLVACLERHLGNLTEHYSKWETDVQTNKGREGNKTKSLDKDKAARASSLAAYYVSNVKAKHPNSTIDGMVDVLMHDAAHYAKLISNLIPILVQLTSDPMSVLLSEREDEDDPREMTSFQELISANAIVYISFESLADSVVGASLGSLFLADLTACAAARHLAGISEPPVSVFVDESAEMMNDPFIQALNKGRSAGFELTLASQTISDFVARMGNDAKAMQVLGNVNTFLSMRILDEDSLQLVAEKFGETTYEEQSSNKSTTTIAAMPGRGRDFTGSVSKSASSSSIPLVDPDLLRSLPAGHFFGHLAGGTKVKGRVLMMPLDDSERYNPDLHGHSSRPRVIEAEPTPHSDTLGHLPTVAVSLDSNPSLPPERDASLLPMPIGAATPTFTDVSEPSGAPKRNVDELERATVAS